MSSPYPPLLVFVAFVLLLVVSVSAPIWDEVAFLKVQLASNPGHTLSLGNWGYCIIQSGHNQCSGSSVGYDMLRIVQRLDGVKSVNSTATAVHMHNLSRGLILHPIACAFAFISLVAAITKRGALFMLCSLIAMVFTMIAMGIDWTVFGNVRHHVNSSDGPGHGASFGSAIWLVTASFIILVFGSVGCSCFIDRRQPHDPTLARRGCCG